MNDFFVEKITRTRTDKGKKVSGIIVETRSQKSAEGQKARLEVEVHSDPAMDENQEGHGPEGRRNRRLASESSPVEQGQILPLPPGPWTEKRCRNCPTYLLKMWRLQDHPQTTL